MAKKRGEEKWNVTPLPSELRDLDNEGCKSLAAAVINQAVKDVCFRPTISPRIKNREAVLLRAERIRRSARRWVQSAECATWCDLAGISHGAFVSNLGKRGLLDGLKQ